MITLTLDLLTNVTESLSYELSILYDLRDKLPIITTRGEIVSDFVGLVDAATLELILQTQRLNAKTKDFIIDRQPAPARLQFD